MKKILITLISLATLLFFQNASALDNFVIQNIQVDGLQGMSSATVLSYLPVKVGDTLTPSDTTKIITSLYESGFFNDVSLSRSGNTLVVHVNPRPVIANISVTGNTLITTDQINKALNNLGLTGGQVLNQSVLDEVTKSIDEEYYNQGHYNASVTTNVTPKSRNRVDVHVIISEGRVVLVKQIQITGNKAFSESDVVNALTLTTPKWYSFVTHGDHYSADSFDKSLQALADFYLNRGYIHFHVDSSHATLTPDRNYVYLMIHITEGAQYHLKGVDLTGNLILPKSTLLALPAVKALKPGTVFSKQALMDATKAIGEALGNVGYAFANIQTVPTVDEQTKQVFINFVVTPGNKVYVRYIHFVGNTATSDSVLRSAMRQPEGSVVDVSNITESTRQINLLGYFQNVQENTKAVPGSTNQVDLDYNVTETPSAQATIGAGYSTDGVVLETGINENNFLGTGRSVGINFNRSEFARTYSVTYNNPYYTPEGVQRGFSLYNSETTPGSVNLASYTFSTYGGSVNFSVPFSEKDSYQFGLGLQRTTLNVGPTPSLQIQSFANAQGTTFNQSLFNIGWTRNDLDRAFFPTYGAIQSFGIAASGPLSGNSLEYYKATYELHAYQPLNDSHSYVLSFLGGAGYGNGYGKTAALPFFVNYYAGGMGFNGAVRGYETNTIGPVDSQGNPYGGNAMLAGSLQLIVPNPISEDNVRTSLFLDSGTVYETENAYNAPQQNISLGQLRYSAGVDVQWRLPVLNAILEVSLAKALDPGPTDQTSPFNFNIGTSF